MKSFLTLLLMISSFMYSFGQVVAIPDTEFKDALINTICADINGDGQLDGDVDINNNGEIEINEASQVLTLIVSNNGISDMTGIHAFVNLIFLACSNNQLASLDLTYNTKLTFVRCEKNQLTNINISTLESLETLLCYQNLLTGLDVSQSKKLKSLEIYGNKITELNISGLDSLHTLYCGGNLLTSLSIENLPSLTALNCANMGLNQLAVTGTPKLISLECHGNNLTSLSVTHLKSLEYLYCMGNSLTSLDVSNLSNLLFLDCYSNQLTDLKITGLINLLKLDCKINQLTELNTSDLPKMTSLICDRNQIQIIDVTQSPLISRLECNDNNLQQLFIKNGKKEFWLEFENNPDIRYICADTIQYKQINDKLVEYGVINCTVNDYCLFTPGGIYYPVYGNIKFANDLEHCDSSDQLIPYLNFKITSATYTGATTATDQGNYTIHLINGTYTIYPTIESPDYFDITPDSFSITFPGTNSPFLQDICITPKGGFNDLEIYVVPVTSARPGFMAEYKLIYKNKGTTTLSGSVSLEYMDGWMDLSQTSIPVDVQSPGQLTWYFNDLQPFQSKEIHISFALNTPQDFPPLNGGEKFQFKASVTSAQDDETPRDNIFVLFQTVINSFDPNDKKCLEGDAITTDMVGGFLHYQIRFENTGTAEAINVVVKDEIDLSVFDINTFAIESSSHDVHARIFNGNVIEFIFEHIYLPFDTASNDGYVVFKIKTRSGLIIGNVLENKADIFFDYNAPIETNISQVAFVETIVLDSDHDGYASDVDCNDQNAAIHPGQEEQVYNGHDDDCNIYTLDDDLDQDGFVLSNDCNDHDPNINPSQLEIPDNGIDENCDGNDLISGTYEMGRFGIQLYPNPVADFLFISYDQGLTLQFRLFDVKGQLILNSFEGTRLFLSFLETGMYFLEIRNVATDEKIVEKIALIKSDN